MVDRLSSGYEQRRRLLEEERARELDRIEENYQNQVKKAEELRENTLKNLYEEQAETIGEKKEEVDRRIAQVKQAADERIREFELSAAKMTEQAKSQYQAKANQLAEYAKEIEQQREHLQKQHSQAMEHIRKEHQRKVLSSHNKMQNESEKLHHAHHSSFQKQELQNEHALRELRNEYKDRKDRTMLEGEREIRALEHQKEKQQAHIEKEISQQNRYKEAQLERIRQSQEIQELQLQQKYDDHLHRIKHSARAAIGKAHREGKRKEQNVIKHYGQQVYETKKESEKKLKNMELRTQNQMSHLEEDAKIREYLAKRNYQYNAQKLEQKRDRMLEEHQKYNKELQKRILDEKAKEEELLREKFQKTLVEKAQGIQESLARLDRVGKKQLNEAIEKHSETLADHAIRTQDSFYQIQNIDAKVEDLGNEYVVNLFVPEHEQDTIRVTLQRDALNISGTRRYEGKVDLPNGGQATTHSYQSYTQSFPVSGKLEMRQMSRSYEDGRLTFRIPKS